MINLKDLEIARSRYYPAAKDKKWGYVDGNGRVVIPFIYDWCEPFSEGIAEVGNADKAGFINKKGELVAPLQYSEVEPFHDGFAIIGNGEFYGMIDYSGKNGK